jgi:FixJ family two-component response regulator
MKWNIYAHIASEQKKATVYRTADEEVSEHYQRLNCLTMKQREILQEYFVHILRQCREGFVIDGTSCSAHIWWNARANISRKVQCNTFNYSKNQ